jgi:DNA-binding NarL/FixJ family response regulator
VKQPRVVPGYVQDRDGEGLTKREREVRDLLKQGLDQPRIAERLGVTKQRVSAVVKSLDEKRVIRRRGNTIEFLTVETVVVKGGQSSGSTGG